MPRFFSNVRTGSGKLIPDDEGDEFSGLDQCRAETLKAAADLLANSRGLDWRGCSFVVTDEQGGTVLVVPFSSERQPKADLDLPDDALHEFGVRLPGASRSRLASRIRFAARSTRRSRPAARAPELGSGLRPAA